MKIKPKYLKSAVFGASDGIVTTFAVVAGVVGAGLSTKIILILGIANMFADGLSMAIGDYLGERSGHKLRIKQGINCKLDSCAHVADHDLLKGRYLWITSLITFIAFILAGTLPLIPYIAVLLGFEVDPESQFFISIITTGLAMFFVGGLRTIVIKGKWFSNGLEMLLIGSVAAIVAYSLGSFVESFLS